MSEEHILITGGLGFIGSITAVELDRCKKPIIIVDNLSNSKLEVLNKIKRLVTTKIFFYQTDLLNKQLIDKIFKTYNIESVIHFGAYKSVHQSIKHPLLYYENNIISLINILESCIKHNVCKFVFSSSSTVYGDSPCPFTEKSNTGKGITNPYGQTKYIAEIILQDVCKANPNFQCKCLRYFNPVGAHPSGILGESPNGIPNNLMPYILRVAYNHNIHSELYSEYNELSIFGGDYATKDGTCIRDFIHVSDLAKAHVYALKDSEKGFQTYNVGTGVGTTVLELVETFKKVNNVILPYSIKERRDGDRDIVYCNTDTITTKLGWKPEKNIEDMCRDSWNFMINSI